MSKEVQNSRVKRIFYFRWDSPENINYPLSTWSPSSPCKQEKKKNMFAKLNPSLKKIHFNLLLFVFSWILTHLPPVIVLSQPRRRPVSQCLLASWSPSFCINQIPGSKQQNNYLLTTISLKLKSIITKHQHEDKHHV